MRQAEACATLTQQHLQRAAPGGVGEGVGRLVQRIARRDQRFHWNDAVLQQREPR